MIAFFNAGRKWTLRQSSILLNFIINHLKLFKLHKLYSQKYNIPRYCILFNDKHLNESLDVLYK